MGIKADTRADAAVLDAAKRCTERWGMAKVTIDDIATEAGVSRATIYRMFPGGKDVLFDALRVRETEDFLVGLRDHVADATTLEELLVRIVGHATTELRVSVAGAAYHSVVVDIGPDAPALLAAVGFSELAPYHAELVGADGQVLATFDGT